jgi:hypothetical protein
VRRGGSLSFFDDFHFCRSRVIGLVMTENMSFTLCRTITSSIPPTTSLSGYNNCLWWPCLLTEQNEMIKYYRGLSIDASYQVSIKKIFWFPMLLKKKYSDFGGGKKHNLIQSFCPPPFKLNGRSLETSYMHCRCQQVLKSYHKGWIILRQAQRKYCW